MADDRTYFRVHDGMDEHPKIAPLSDGAFRLIVETWAYCSRNRTDGRITDALWKKRGKPKARRELEVAGLVEQHDGYVQVHDYLDWQRSAAEIDEYIEKKRRASVKGTHVRYHVGEGRPDPRCPLCADDDRPAGAAAPDPENTSQVASHPASQLASQNGAQRQRQRQRQKEPLTSEGDVPEVDARDPNDPPLFPDRCKRHGDVYEPPNCGACADVRKARLRLASIGPHNPATKPHCGECDEARLLRTRFGTIPCPNCNPAAEAS